MFDKEKYKLVVIVAYDTWMTAARRYAMIPDENRQAHAFDYIKLSYGKVGFGILKEYLKSLGTVK